MKSWFPFSDYDFYGYLVSGFTLLFVVDYTLNNGEVMLRNDWTFVETVLAVGIAYFAGQLMAVPSSIVVEHFVARTLLQPPINIMLSADKPTGVTGFVGKFIIGRYYSPLPAEQRNKVVRLAALDNETDEKSVRQDLELVFAPAYNKARQVPDIRERMDSFRNQYGLNRNMSFTALIVALLFGWKAWFLRVEDAELWVAFSIFFFIGTFIRFLKFYAAFSAEILRSYCYSSLLTSQRPGE